MSTLKSISRIAASARPGKQAIKGEHRGLLFERGKYRLAESADFEQALKGIEPRRKRVDYLFCTALAPDAVRALEVHPWKPTELVEKKCDTKHLLAQHCQDMTRSVRSWHVIITGSLPRADLKARFEVDSGLKVAGRNLSLEKII